MSSIMSFQELVDLLNITPNKTTTESTLKVYNSFSVDLRDKVDAYDSFNSIIFSFYKDFDNEFSIEVINDKIGYFSEVESKTIHFCECEVINETSLKKINEDILDYYERINDGKDKP